MNKKNILYLTGLMLTTGSLFSADADRLAKLQEQVNAIVKNSKEQADAINRLASNILQLERKQKGAGAAESKSGMESEDSDMD